MARLNIVCAFCLLAIGCSKDEQVSAPTPPAPAMATNGPGEVVIYVPAMVCESCSEHVAGGLARLPWIDADSIQPDRKSRQVRFRVKDRSAFDLDAVKNAIARAGYKDVQLLTGPTES